MALRKAELEDAKSQIESEVRNAYLDLRAAETEWKWQDGIYAIRQRCEFF